jgi:Pentapeptide repeats (8 copies)
MVTEKPRFTQDPLYKLIRAGNPDDFNRRRASGAKVDLRGVDLRNIDLRGFDLSGLDLSNAYLRQADLRGQDLGQCRLEGASIRGAHISGVTFPPELAPDEIRLSLDHGTRLRYRGSGR